MAGQRPRGGNNHGVRGRGGCELRDLEEVKRKEGSTPDGPVEPVMALRFLLREQTLRLLCL